MSLFSTLLGLCQLSYPGQFKVVTEQKVSPRDIAHARFKVAVQGFSYIHVTTVVAFFLTMLCLCGVRSFVLTLWEITQILDVSTNTVTKNVIFIGRLLQYLEPSSSVVLMRNTTLCQWSVAKRSLLTFLCSSLRLLFLFTDTEL